MICECGCGRKTNIIKRNDTFSGLVKGTYRRFIVGHSTKGKTNLRPRSKVYTHKYRLIWMPEHPKSNNRGYVREHFLIVEKVLGRNLKDTEVVHHINEIRDDNRKCNLVILERKMHPTIHLRMRAYKATGDPNKRKCSFCKEWDDPENLFIKFRKPVYHNACKVEYNKMLKNRGTF